MEDVFNKQTFLAVLVEVLGQGPQKWVFIFKTVKTLHCFVDLCLEENFDPTVSYPLKYLQAGLKEFFNEFNENLTVFSHPVTKLLGIEEELKYPSDWLLLD